MVNPEYANLFAAAAGEVDESGVRAVSGGNDPANINSAALDFRKGPERILQAQVNRSMNQTTQQLAQQVLSPLTGLVGSLFGGGPFGGNHLNGRGHHQMSSRQANAAASRLVTEYVTAAKSDLALAVKDNRMTAREAGAAGRELIVLQYDLNMGNISFQEFRDQVEGLLEGDVGTKFFNRHHQQASRRRNMALSENLNQRLARHKGRA